MLNRKPPLVIFLAIFLLLTVYRVAWLPGEAASVVNLFPGERKSSPQKINSNNIVHTDASSFNPLLLRPVFNHAAVNIIAPQPPDTEYTLPVVVHIVNQDPQAVSDQAIINAINDLNDAFGKAGTYAASKGFDTRIKFCLAQKGPDGGNTTGITRTKYSFGQDLNPDIEDARLKDLVQWDPQRYINIWYINSMDAEISASFTCGIWTRTSEGGYATLPPNAGPSDGIVVTGFGTLLAHEMGHYLGLLHTFSGSCINTNCLTDGDQVCDTPPEYAPSASNTLCGTYINTCSTDTLSGFTKDMPDPTANFMDYGNSGCHNEFTKGQAQRMRNVIATQRSTLLQNECAKPCANNITAGFTRDNNYPLPGDNITFTNTSAGATNYQWLVDGAVVSSSQNFSHTFNSTGKFKVTLKAYTNDPACFAEYSDYVKVTCGVTARFYTDKKHIASKAPIYLDSIVFTNTSVNATSYKWLMANDKGMVLQVVSTQKNLTYVFKTPGNYTVSLIASNGGCSDTTGFYAFPVDDPTQDGTAWFSSVDCYQQTKIQVSLFVCNNGYAAIPAGIPISFYDADPRQPGANKLSPSFILPDAIPGRCCGYLYTHVLDVGKRGLNQLYMVFNDSGTTSPLKLPNTNMNELNYADNIQRVTGFQFKVTADPVSFTTEPGDTVQLKATVSPAPAASFTWSPAYNLSCAACATTNLIADTPTTKRIVAASQYGCTDTGYVTIKIPPYNDFTLAVDDVQCASGDSLHINFTITNNFKRGIIPAGLPVSFYNASPTAAAAAMLPPVFTVPDTVLAKTASFSTIVANINAGSLVYGVVNDSGKALPVTLPNISFAEKDYTNNNAKAAYTRLKATATPQQATLEPGDTLQMVASGVPGNITSYLWAPPLNISCLSCATTLLFADSNRVKLVTVTNEYGCMDTASVTIKVPPANDYTVTVNDIECAGTDSLYVNFTLNNFFKRGVLPKGLTVAWYNADPTTGVATLLPPLFAVQDTVKLKQATFSTFIKATAPGTVYAVVNDSGTTTPLQLPNVVHLPEKDYTNNIYAYNYQPEKVLLQPADTTIIRKGSFTYAVLTPIVDAASTVWQQRSGYTLSCYTCSAPVATIFSDDTVIMHTANKFGCLLEGRAIVKIIAPDFTVQLLSTDCYTNDSTLVSFRLCMNNNYDSVFAGLPVSFYDANPASPGAHLLQPVFYTQQLQPGNCLTYFVRVSTPLTHTLYASVNDKGNPGAPLRIFDETDLTNNTANAAVAPFTATIIPADTSIKYGGSVVLNIQASSSVTGILWKPSTFLSCTDCMATTVTPPYTMNYYALLRNKYFCVDTSYAIVRTYRGSDVNIPSAFTPNGDGHNDVFYVLAGKTAALVKTFAVFNRWGNAVFKVNNVIPNTPEYGWHGDINGVNAPAGTYVYYVTMQFADGTQKTYKGTVVLVR